MQKHHERFQLPEEFSQLLRKIAKAEQRSFSSVAMEACIEFAEQYLKSHPDFGKSDS